MNWIRKLSSRQLFADMIFKKKVCVPFIGQNLVCKTDTQEEAIKYDKNAIGALKSDDNEISIKHLQSDYLDFLILDHLMSHYLNFTILPCTFSCWTV